MTYDDVFQKRASVRIYVEDGIMPPSPARPGHVPFRDDNLLTDDEIQTIADWVHNGAPLGDPDAIPPIPEIPEGLEIPIPDASLQINPYMSQAQHHDDYRCFALETSFTEDKWITGIEIVPGNKEIVHHVILFEEANDVVLDLDDQDPLPGYECFGGVGSFTANFVGGWVPGQSAQFLPEGMGLVIPQGTNLVIQTHYPEGTDGKIDSTRVNLQFAESGAELREVSVVPYINHLISITNGPLFIPANTVRTFHAEALVLANVSLIGVLPHMHLIGTSMFCYAIPPGGDTIVLFDIPKWDFEWQLSYQYRRPVHLPFGTRIYADAVYDNTTNNVHNPSSPPVDVSAGEATTDEMFLIFFSYLLYEQGDEDMVFEDPPPFADACSEIVGVERVNRQTLKIFPNPANTMLTIETSLSEYTLTLYDAFGRLVVTGRQLQHVSTASLHEGMYFLSISTREERLVEKVMIAH
jgi:hypothetical protein